MIITESIIYGIEKEKDVSGEGTATVVPPNDLLPLDDRLQTLGDDVLKLYGRLSNGYGTLGANLDIHVFPKLLADYHSNETDLVTMSDLCTEVIAREMAEKRFTTTSYPIFIRYENQGRDWLLVAMLKLKEGVGIDSTTLELNDSLFFDVGNLREAARIDIEKWRQNEQPYLSFIKKGSGAEGDSSAYFRKALACQDYTDSKYNTQLLIDTLDLYCEEKELEPAQRQAIRAKVYEHCKEMKDTDRPVHLVALSAFINPEEPESFIDYVKDNEVPIHETFSPHNSSFKKLQRFTTKFGTISLGFDVEDVFSERIYLQDDDESVVIRNPSAELIARIKKEKGILAEDNDNADE